MKKIVIPIILIIALTATGCSVIKEQPQDATQSVENVIQASTEAELIQTSNNYLKSVTTVNYETLDEFPVKEYMGQHYLASIEQIEAAYLNGMKELQIVQRTLNINIGEVQINQAIGTAEVDFDIKMTGVENGAVHFRSEIGKIFYEKENGQWLISYATSKTVE